MNAQQSAPLMGYFQNFGTKNAGVFELAGPTLYAAGGQTLNASQFGMGGFDFVDAGGGLSYSGTYYCRIQYLPVDAAPSAQTPGGNTQVKVVWYVLATNAEAGAIDLSTEIVRLFAMGV